MNRRRVVITGLGVVAPNGIGKEAFWNNLIAGKSAVDYISAFDASKQACKVGAEIREFDFRAFSTRKTKLLARDSQLAVAAAILATEDAKLSRPQLRAAAVCFGTATHALADIGTASHEVFLQNGSGAIPSHVGLELIAHAATAHVRSELEIEGPSTTITSACCSGVDVLEWGAEKVRNGTVEIAVVGAAEAPISEFIFGLFTANRYICTWVGSPAEASRPYDRLRCGLVIGEAAAVLILEDRDRALNRGAQIYAEALGYGNVGESPGLSIPDGYVLALKSAVVQSITRSGLSVEDIDYVCAHGNSTPFDDEMETRAHKLAFGDHAYKMPISSIKSMIGQPFAASGLLQSAATTLAIRDQIAPPTINYRVRDPNCDLDYVPNRSRRTRIRSALVHSHSLGGHIRGSHCAVVLSAPK